MTLSDDQKELFAEWMSAHASHFTCPICDEMQWEVEGLITPNLHGVEGVSNDPLVQVVCPCCAYVELFSATRMGLV